MEKPSTSTRCEGYPFFIDWDEHERRYGESSEERIRSPEDGSSNDQVTDEGGIRWLWVHNRISHWQMFLFLDKG